MSLFSDSLKNPDISKQFIKINEEMKFFLLIKKMWKNPFLNNDW